MPGLKILIFDSDPRWIVHIKNNLVNFKVGVASATEEALSALDNNHYDLVIASSLQLPAIEKRQYAGQTVCGAKQTQTEKKKGKLIY